MKPVLVEIAAPAEADANAEVRSGPQALGMRIRSLRHERGFGVRELASRIGVSPSLISQIELGKGAPSVKTLYALVAALDVPLAQFFGPDSEQRTQNRTAPSGPSAPAGEDRPGLVQKGNLRRSIQLEHEFRWERLTRNPDPNVEFIELHIGVGGGADGKSEMKTHQGKEYGVVLQGRLGISLAFDNYVLEPTDSISFDSTLPHCMWNAGLEPVRAIWFVVGRSAR